MAPVDARILEDGRDPEEGGVRVAHLEIRREEKLTAPELPEPDCRECAGERHEGGRKGARGPALEGRTRDDGCERRKRKQEEDELDRAVVCVGRPGEGRRREQGERGRRACEEERDRLQLGSAQNPRYERQHGG